ncbi:receptor-like protein EIX1 [Camellia sinensis]|uniref:receptor-like protein EIX1 n=1 Tax=Camellia sinensis TaxID=4442 RepID=UPI0010367588|nr:receptor-like protein EIX1 [Camellia sinensis]
MGSSSMRIAAIVFYYLCFLTFATFHNCFCNGNSNIVCSKTEKQALLKFKQDLKDPSNRLSSWAGDNCCQWSGVVCDNFTGHVHEIHLPYNDGDAGCHYNGNYSKYETCWSYHPLGGKINPSLLDLKHLRYLDLSQNYFGEIHIPTFIGSIGSLRYLNLSKAGFSGAIPHQLGNLTMMRYLDLSRNRFGGIHIPSFIGSIGSLRYLDLSNAEFSGAIPHQLGNLTMMRYLDLSWNRFGGIRIPSFIGSIGSLRYLDLSGAEFSGAIPHQLGNLTMIRYLDLSFNFFYLQGNFSETALNLRGDNLHWVSGLLSLQHLDLSFVNLSKAVDWVEVMSTLPSLVELQLGGCDLKYSSPSTTINFTSLHILDLSDNNFAESIPKWIFSLHHLVSLDIIDCNFYGPIPNGIQNLTSLKEFSAVENNLNSSLPKGLFGLKNLVVLDLGFNKFQGPIPIGLLNMTCLRDLDLGDNLFTTWTNGLLSRLSRLESVNLADNLLQGVISGAIGNLTSLISLDMSHNQLEGKISSSLGKLCKLKSIGLSNNKFGGEVAEVFRGFSHCMLDGLESMALDNNCLDGQFPNELHQFKNLTYLSLQNNSIFGPIPESIKGLSSLTRLSLSYNHLTGVLPESLGQLAKLETLDLSYNHLNGTLPESLGQLAKLESLDVSHNLMKGVVSEIHFGNLKRLSCLDGSGNNLTLKVHSGWIPTFQVRALMLASWQLGPQFPAWLQYQGQLHTLDIASTGISDSIPQWFWPKISNLSLLNLSRNQIRGEFPRKFEVLISGYALDLSFNNFKGMLPFISSNVQWLDFSNNSFSGSVYHALCGRMRKQNWLFVLNLGNNYLSGRIPNCWQHWQYLQVLKLENNKLMGTIPLSIGHLASLESLHLRHNNLSGKLPQSLQHCINLVLIDLGGNEFIGSIPPWMGNSFTKLVVLNLRSNKFQGGIPYELCRLSSLQILDLAHNNLSTVVPKCFNNFTAMTEKQNSSNLFSYHALNLTSEAQEKAFLVTKGREVEYSTTLKFVTSMDLSENNLSGEIPKELTTLVGLHFLNLSGNHFTGEIPKNIGDMEQLESLDFSLNQLCGEIPLSMSSLTFLSHLNLSYNNLIGQIPLSTQLQSLENSSFVGNKLCGPPLPNCDTNKAIPKVGHGGNEEGEGFPEVWFYAISALGFVIGFWVVMGPLLFKMHWRIAYFRFLDDIWYNFYKIVVNGIKSIGNVQLGQEAKEEAVVHHSNRFWMLKKMRFKLVGDKGKEYVRHGIEVVDWFFPVDVWTTKIRYWEMLKVNGCGRYKIGIVEGVSAIATFLLLL